MLVSDYIKNLGRSVTYGGSKIIKEDASSIHGYLESNQEVMSAMYHTVKDYREVYRKVKVLLSKSVVYKAVEVGTEGIIDTIKTGKFYDQARSDRYEKKAMDSMGMSDDSGDFNIDESSFSFDDSGFDEKSFNFDDVGDGDKFIVDTIEGTSRQSAIAISESVAQTGKLIMENERATTSLMLTHQQKMFSNLQNSFGEMSNTLKNIQEGMLKVHVDNSAKYYDTTTKIMQTQMEMIKEMRDMQLEVFKSKNLGKKKDVKERAKRPGYSDLVGSAGELNIAEYFSSLKYNLKDVGNKYPMFALPGGEGGMDIESMLLSFAANPLEAVPAYVMKGLMGPHVTKALKNFDKTVAGVFGTFISKMNHMAKDQDNPIAEIIGTLFGVKDSVKSSLETSKYEKGPVPFDGVVRKSIVDVIPGYLRRIETAITGQTEKIYDWEQGRWANKEELNDKWENDNLKAMATATSELAEGINKLMTRVKFQNRDDDKRFRDSTLRALKKIYSDSGYFEPNADLDYSEYGFDDENQFKMFKEMFKKLPKSTQMGLAGNVQTERNKLNRHRSSMEGTDNILNLLFDNSTQYRRNSKNELIEGQAGLGKSILTSTLDKYNRNVFFYLQNIYTELSWIRRNGFGINDTGKNTGNLGNTQVFDADGKVINYKPIPLPGIDTVKIETKGYTKEQKDRSDRKREEDAYNRNLKKSLRNGRGSNIDNKVYLYQGIDQDPDEEGKGGITTDRDNYRALFENERLKAQKEAFESEKEDIGWIYKFVHGNIDDLRGISEEDRKKADEKGKNVIRDIFNAETIKDKYNLIKDKLSDIAQAPGSVIAGLIERADESIYDFFFGREQSVIDKDSGKKIRGFFDRMIYEMKNTFTGFGEWMEKNLLDPILKKLDVKTVGEAFKKMSEKIFGEDPWKRFKEFAFGEDSLLGKTGKAISGMFGDAFQLTKDSLVDSFNDLSDVISGKVEEIKSIPVETPLTDAQIKEKAKGIKKSMDTRTASQKMKDILSGRHYVGTSTGRKEFDDKKLKEYEELEKEEANLLKNPIGSNNSKAIDSLKKRIKYFQDKITDPDYPENLKPECLEYIEKAKLKISLLEKAESENNKKTNSLIAKRDEYKSQISQLTKAIEGQDQINSEDMKNVNNQISELTKTLDSLKSNISEIEKSPNAKSPYNVEKIKELKTQVKSIEDQLSTLNSEKGDIEERQLAVQEIINSISQTKRKLNLLFKQNPILGKIDNRNRRLSEIANKKKSIQNYLKISDDMLNSNNIANISDSSKKLNAIRKEINDLRKKYPLDRYGRLVKGPRDLAKKLIYLDNELKTIKIAISKTISLIDNSDTPDYEKEKLSEELKTYNARAEELVKLKSEVEKQIKEAPKGNEKVDSMIEDRFKALMDQAKSIATNHKLLKKGESLEAGSLDSKEVDPFLQANEYFSKFNEKSIDEIGASFEAMTKMAEVSGKENIIGKSKSKLDEFSKHKQSFMGRVEEELRTLFNNAGLDYGYKEVEDFIKYMINGKNYKFLRKISTADIKDHLKEYKGMTRETKSKYFNAFESKLSPEEMALRESRGQQLLNSDTATGNKPLNSIYDVTGEKQISILSKISDTVSNIYSYMTNIDPKSSISDLLTNKATGARYIDKSGIAAISEGEMIIPAELNPFNPNRNSVDKKKELANENRIKDEYSKSIPDKISSKIKNYAAGTTSAEMSDVPLSDANTAVNTATASQNIQKAKESIMSWIFGDKEKADKSITEIKNKVNTYFPKAIAGSLLGGTLGLVTGLFSPLLMAAGGAALSVASDSEKAKEFLFGSKVKEASGEEVRQGGMFSKEFQQGALKYLPDLTKYGITGAVLGTLLPGFGIVGGIAGGAAVAFAKNNKEISDALFGDSDGLFNKERKEKIKKSLPNIAVGALGMATLGPDFGLVTNLILGAGVGMASASDEVKNALFGVPDKDGKRIGVERLKKAFPNIATGILGTFMLDPFGMGIIPKLLVGSTLGLASMSDDFKDGMNGLKDGLVDFLVKDVINPIKRAVPVLAKDITLGIKGAFKNMGWLLNKIIGDTIGKSLSSRLNDTLKKWNPLKLLNKTGGWALNKIRGVASLPGKGLDWFTNRRSMAHIESGNADYMGARERLEFFEDHKDIASKQGVAGMYAKHGRDLESLGISAESLKDGEYAYKKFDQNLANMSKKEIGELIQNVERYNQTGEDAKKRRKDNEGKLFGLLDSKIENSKDRDAVLNLLRNTDDRQGVQDILKKHVKITELDSVMKEAFGYADGAIGAKNDESNLKEAKKRNADAVREALGISIDDNNIERVLKTLRAEEKFRSKDEEGRVKGSPVDIALEVQGKRHEDIITCFTKVIEVLESIDKGTGELTEEQLKRNSVINQTTSKAFEEATQSKAKARAQQFGFRDMGYDNISDDSLDKLSRNPEIYNIIKQMDPKVAFKDVNKIISMDPASIRRISDLQNLGIELDPKQYEEIAKLSDEEFSRVRTLTNAGFKFEKLSDITSMTPEEYKYTLNAIDKGLGHMSSVSDLKDLKKAGFDLNNKENLEKYKARFKEENPWVMEKETAMAKAANLRDLQQQESDKLSKDEEYQKLRQDAENLKGAREKLGVNIAGHHDKIAEFDNRIGSSNKSVNDINTKIASLKTRQKSSLLREQEKIEVGQVIGIQKENISGYDAKISDLLGQVDTLEKNLKDKSKTDQNELLDKIANLQRQLSEVVKEKVNTQDKIDKLEKGFAESEKEQDEIQAELDKQQEENSKLKEELSKLQKDKDEYTNTHLNSDQIAKNDAKKKQLEEDLAKTQAKINEKEANFRSYVDQESAIQKSSPSYFKPAGSDSVRATNVTKSRDGSVIDDMLKDDYDKKASEEKARAKTDIIIEKINEIAENTALEAKISKEEQSENKKERKNKLSNWWDKLKDLLFSPIKTIADNIISIAGTVGTIYSFLTNPKATITNAVKKVGNKISNVINNSKSLSWIKRTLFGGEKLLPDGTVDPEGGKTQGLVGKAWDYAKEKGSSMVDKVKGFFKNKFGTPEPSKLLDIDFNDPFKSLKYTPEQLEELAKEAEGGAEGKKGIIGKAFDYAGKKWDDFKGLFRSKPATTTPTPPKILEVDFNNPMKALGYTPEQVNAIGGSVGDEAVNKAMAKRLLVEAQTKAIGVIRDIGLKFLPAETVELMISKLPQVMEGISENLSDKPTTSKSISKRLFRGVPVVNLIFARYFYLAGYDEADRLFKIQNPDETLRQWGGFVAILDLILSNIAGAYGASAGSAVGGAMGSVVPGVGTGIGAGVGWFAGGVAGGYALSLFIDDETIANVVSDVVLRPLGISDIANKQNELIARLQAENEARLKQGQKPITERELIEATANHKSFFDKVKSMIPGVGSTNNTQPPKETPGTPPPGDTGTPPPPPPPPPGKEPYQPPEGSLLAWGRKFFGGKGSGSKYGMGHYSQLDPMYYNMPYNASGDSQSQTLGDSGCGVMAASTVLDRMGGGIDPITLSQYATKKGYKEKDGGTKPELFTDIFGKFGIGGSVDTNKSDLMKNIKSGIPTVLMGKDTSKGSSTPFGPNPHYVVGTGIDRNGNMIIQDPESRTPDRLFKANDVMRGTTLGVKTGMGSGRNNKYKYGKGPSIGTVSYDDLAKAIAQALIETRIEGEAGHINENDGDGMPSIGMSQWHAGRATNLLNQIPGGAPYAAKVSIPGACTSEDFAAISSLLVTDVGKSVQLNQLATDCNVYIEEVIIPIQQSHGLVNPQVATYIGMWCPIGTYTVLKTVNNCLGSDGINNLAAVHNAFINNFYRYAGWDYETYSGRAESSYEYCSSLSKFANIKLDPSNIGNGKYVPSGNNSSIGMAGKTNSTKKSGLFGLFDNAISDLSNQYTNLLLPGMNMIQTGFNSTLGQAAKMVFGDDFNLPGFSTPGSKSSGYSGSKGNKYNIPTQNVPGGAKEWAQKNMGLDTITSEYGPRYHPVYHENRMHDGIDFGTPEGTKVLSPVDGEIIDAGPAGDYGILCSVKDSNGHIHEFGHLSSVNVSPGDKVKVGDVIALSGNTGSSTGPHIHYTVRQPDGQSVDPGSYKLPRTASNQGKGSNNPIKYTPKQSKLSKSLISPSPKYISGGIGGVDTIDYRELLQSIIKILIQIAANTQGMDKVISFLGEKSGMPESEIAKAKAQAPNMDIGNRPNSDILSGIKGLTNSISSIMNSTGNNGVSSRFNTLEADINTVIKAMEMLSARK